MSKLVETPCKTAQEDINYNLKPISVLSRSSVNIRLVAVQEELVRTCVKAIIFPNSWSLVNVCIKADQEKEEEKRGSYSWQVIKLPSEKRKSLNHWKTWPNYQQQKILKEKTTSMSKSQWEERKAIKVEFLQFFRGVKNGIFIKAKNRVLNMWGESPLEFVLRRK